MQATRLTSIEQFRSDVAAFHAPCDDVDASFEALKASQEAAYGRSFNRQPEIPAIDATAAELFAQRALEARGEYRAYLIQRLNEALSLGPNDAHISHAAYYE